MKNYQAIFQIYIAGDEKWLDYCRERVDKPSDAEPMMRQAAEREGRPFRVKVEHWDEPGEMHEPDVKYGDWGA